MSSQPALEPYSDDDSTEELPVLDPAAYRAQLEAQDEVPIGASEEVPRASPAARPAAPPPPAFAADVPAASPAHGGLDADMVLGVERWLAQTQERLQAVELGRRELEERAAREGAQREAVLREREAELAREYARAEQLARDMDALRSVQARLEERLATRESYRSRYESICEELEQAMQAQQAQAARAQDHARALAEQLVQREERIRALESTLAGRAVALDEAESRRSGLEADLGTRAARISALEAELSRERLALSGLRGELEMSHARIAVQAQEIAARETATRALAEAQQEQLRLVSALREQIDGLTARLAAPEAQRRALEERINVLGAELAASEAQRTRLEGVNRELRRTQGLLHESLSERDAELQNLARLASSSTYALGRVQRGLDALSGDADAGEASDALADAVLTRLDAAEGASIVVRGRTTIGRDADNDVQISARFVSRHHAVLIPGYRSTFVQDLGSSNGVLVNGRRVRCARVLPGDVVSIGKAQFRLSLAPAQGQIGHAAH